jgi:hypothetical protein
VGAAHTDPALRAQGDRPGKAGLDLRLALARGLGGEGTEIPGRAEVEHAIHRLPRIWPTRALTLAPPFGKELKNLTLFTVEPRIHSSHLQKTLDRKYL